MRRSSHPGSISGRRRAATEERGRPRPRAGRCRTCASPYRRANDGGPVWGHCGILGVDGSAPRGSSRSPVGRDRFSSTSLDNSQSKNKECQSTPGPPVDAGPGRIETRRAGKGRSSLPCWELSPSRTSAHAKRRLDQLSGVTGWRLHDLRRTCVSGMARLGIAPHIADKILNHQSGTISGVAAVYQRHDFLAERRAALDAWGAHVDQLLANMPDERGIGLKAVA